MGRIASPDKRVSFVGIRGPFERLQAGIMAVNLHIGDNSCEALELGTHVLCKRGFQVLLYGWVGAGEYLASRVPVMQMWGQTPHTGKVSSEGGDLDSRNGCLGPRKL